MELLQQAERFEAIGNIKAAMERYREYIALQKNPSADVYYKAGRIFLASCAATFEQDLYEEGIAFLMESYNRGYHDKEALYNLLFEIVCSPNLADLKERYQKNIILMQEKYEEFPCIDFAALPFALFPIHAMAYRVYDKAQDLFLEKDVVKLEYGPYLAAMFYDAITETAWICRMTETVLHEWRGRALLENLQSSLTKNMGHENFLRQAKEFHGCLPFSQQYECLLARYYIAKGEEQRALAWIEQGLGKYRLNLELRTLAADCYFRQGAYDKAAAAFVFLAVKDDVKVWFDATSYEIPGEYMKKMQQCIEAAGRKSHDFQQQTLRAMTEALRHARGFITGKEFVVDQAGQIGINTYFLLGKVFETVNANLQYFCGLYTEYTRQGTCAAQTETLLRSSLVLAYRTTYDVLDAALKKKFSYVAAQYPCLIPFMATEHNQSFHISYKDKEYDEKFGKLECNFLRLDAPLKLASTNHMAIGQPIILRHDAKRKKLVLSILLDALSFAKVAENNFALMPNSKRFFDRGIIFAKNYTPAEWTLSSAATIQTGVYQDRHQISHPNVFVRLAEEYQTTAEYMREKGYYCMLLEGCLSPQFCNTYRGFHRAIGNESYSADRLVADAMKHMQALQETDLFMHLHLLDAHVHGQPIALEQKVNLDLETYLNLSLSDSKSVWSTADQANLRHYEEKMKQLDRVMGNLFAYLEQTYEEDSYVVVLHSDHGISVVGDEPYLFKKGLANAVFMARGSGVPNCGVVEQEVTNTMDVYATLAHLCGCDIADDLDCRLPKVFGGEGREYSVSNSLYPGQTYKLCIHTLQHVFFLETEGMVTIDGRVNMNEFQYRIFTGDDEHTPVQDEELAAHFIDIALAHTKRIHDFTL